MEQFFKDLLLMYEYMEGLQIAAKGNYFNDVKSLNILFSKLFDKCFENNTGNILAIEMNNCRNNSINSIKSNISENDKIKYLNNININLENISKYFVEIKEDFRLLNGNIFSLLTKFENKNIDISSEINIISNIAKKEYYFNISKLKLKSKLLFFNTICEDIKIIHFLIKIY